MCAWTRGLKFSREFVYTHINTYTHTHTGKTYMEKEKKKI